MLKLIYIELLKNYTDDNSLRNELWNEIEQLYSDKKRHYHNLLHLENLLNELLEVKDKIENWNTILFTLFYHDIIYNVLKSDNEEQSAELAEKRMKQINVPIQIIEKCKSQILATKKHIDNSDIDTNFFIDADLSILGKDNETYSLYKKNVRLEYLYYPSVIYKHGRAQVLDSFRNFDRVYKTDYFSTKYEQNAKRNIDSEVEAIKKIKDIFFLNCSQQWCFSIENDGDWYEFFQDGVDILEKTKGVEIINYYPGFFDSAYCRFNYKNVKLNLEFEGMLGLDLRTEPNPTESDLKIAREIYEILKQPFSKNIEQGKIGNDTFRDDLRYKRADGMNAYLFMFGNDNNGYRQIRLAIYKD